MCVFGLNLLSRVLYIARCGCFMAQLIIVFQRLPISVHLHLDDLCNPARLKQIVDARVCMHGSWAATKTSQHYRGTNLARTQELTEAKLHWVQRDATDSGVKKMQAAAVGPEIGILRCCENRRRHASVISINNCEFFFRWHFLRHLSAFIRNLAANHISPENSRHTKVTYFVAPSKTTDPAHVCYGFVYSGHVSSF